MDSLKQRRLGGIALLETMLALALFGLIAVSLVGLLRNISLLSLESTQRHHAVVHSRTLLEERLHSPLIEAETTEFGPDAYGITYRVRVMEEVSLKNQDGFTLPGMYRIQVSAKWEEDGRETTLEAESLRNALLYR